MRAAIHMAALAEPRRTRRATSYLLALGIVATTMGWAGAAVGQPVPRPAGVPDKCQVVESCACDVNGGACDMDPEKENQDADLPASQQNQEDQRCDCDPLCVEGACTPTCEGYAASQPACCSCDFNPYACDMLGNDPGQLCQCDPKCEGSVSGGKACECDMNHHACDYVVEPWASQWQVAPGSRCSCDIDCFGSFSIGGRIGARGLVLRNAEGKLRGHGFAPRWAEYPEGGEAQPLDVPADPSYLAMTREQYVARYPEEDEPDSPWVLVDGAGAIVYAGAHRIGFDAGASTWVAYNDLGQKFDLSMNAPQNASLTVIPFELYKSQREAADLPVDVPEGTRTVLVDEEGAVVTYSEHVIAQESDFLTFDKGEAQHAATLGSCLFDQDAILAAPGGSEVDLDIARARKFVTCSPGNMLAADPCPAGGGASCQSLRAWAPIQNARVDMPDFTTFRRGLTDANGFYILHYRSGPTFNGFEFDINATLAFESFEPRSSAARFFYVTSSVVGGSDPIQQTIINTLLTNTQFVDRSTSVAGSRGMLHANFPIEAAMLTLDVRMSPDGQYDPEGSGASTLVELTGYPKDGATKPTRYSQGSPDTAGDLGLLQKLPTPDLRDTEIYVYRVADGKLVGQRYGMLHSEVFDYSTLGIAQRQREATGNSAAADCAGRACMRVSTLIRGPASIYLSHTREAYNPATSAPAIREDGTVRTPAKFGLELDYDAGLGGGRVPFLRPGDQAKVIVINRATGYMGTKIVRMQRGANGMMGFAEDGRLPGMPVFVTLGPPNLKVKVRRTPKTGTTQQGSYLIGFEGSGLESDEQITVETEWLDEYDQPLPEDLPGFTGRLAKVVMSEQNTPTLDGVGDPPDCGADDDEDNGCRRNPTDEDRAGFFNIQPGKHTHVIRLRDEEISRSHFYLHVDAQPLRRNVDFIGRPPPAGPSFSVNQVCYSDCFSETGGGGAVPVYPPTDPPLFDHCGQGSRGIARWSCFARPRSPEEEGALVNRPANFVPFLTARYNHERTRAQQEAAGVGATVPPEHDWVYRPEMQFSLFSLEMEAIRILEEDGSLRNVLGEETALRSADDLVRVFYSLFAPEQEPLQDIDGEERVIGFMLGDLFEEATIGTNQDLTIRDPRTVRALSIYDWLALRLVQRGDEGNVLWEQVFKDLRVYFTRQGERVSILEIGAYTDANAVLNPPNPNATFRWKIISTEDGVEARVGETTGLIWVSATSKEGSLILEAKDASDEDVFTRVKVPVGCECVSCNTPGSCDVRMGSVDLTWSLGRSEAGLSAGTLYLKQDVIDDDAHSRRHLAISALDETVEVLSDYGGIRQVIAPGVFVDIHDLQVEEEAPYGYELRFYETSARAADVNEGTGFYDLAPEDPHVDPFTVWRIEAGGQGARGPILRVTESRDGSDRVHEYEQDAATQAFVLTQGGGLRIEEREQSVDTTGRTVRTTISDRSASGARVVRSVVEQRYHNFDWGQALVRETRETETKTLETHTEYYQDVNDPGSWGKVWYRIEPDGSWVAYTYDDHGRTLTEMRPWLDQPSHPATALPAHSRVIQHAYDDGALHDASGAPDPYFDTPRVTREIIAGRIVSLTYRSVQRDSDGGTTIVEQRCNEPTASVGSSSCLSTTTTHFPPSEDAITSGRVRSVFTPEGLLTTHTYERGSWNGTAFTPGAGRAMRHTVISGTSQEPQGVPYKSTREVTILDEFGKNVRTERWVRSLADYELVEWTVHGYDSRGRLEQTLRSNGELETVSWGCCSEDSRTDSRGITTRVTARDGLDRVKNSERAGITTTYDYDGEGRVLRTTRQGGGATLFSEQVFDRAGRLKESVDEQGLVTIYDYELGGLRTTVTRPGGFVEVTENYLDGQTKSVTGDAVVAQRFTHGINDDGTRWTRVCVGPEGSQACETTTVDMLGRTIRVERPGFSDAIEVASTFYNEKGQVARTSTTGLADTLYEYDEVGQQIRTGLDIDGADPEHGELQVASADRITETRTHFIEIAGDWWQQTEQVVYPEVGATRAVIVGTTRSRLTGLGGGGLVSEQVSIDVHGNETRSAVYIDPNSRTETRVVDVPDSTIDAETVIRDGRVMSTTSATGVTIEYVYDGLGRRQVVIDPRTGQSQTHYDPTTGRVDWVEDAAGNQTTFAYDPLTGRKVGECNALGNCSYFEYDARGQLIRTWGDVPYPVQYVYDDYGRRTEMHTYRDDSFDWTAPEWPEGSSIVADVTTWDYEESTGLLEAKIDAAGQATTYTYGPGGRLATRTWARPRAGGGPLVTTYGYDEGTGELLTVDYNDSTPDATYTYDRLGRQQTVTDAVGLRSFAYDPDTLQFERETITGMTPAVLTRHYAPNGPVIGRATGLSLGNDYSVSYGYASNGRFETLGWTVNGQSDAATYSYEPDSELLGGYVTSSGLAVSYGYEPERDLKTQVQNSFGGAVMSQYDYRYDAIGRRTSVENSGSAFAATRFTNWGYDDRNQVTGSNRYAGAFTASPNPANEVSVERRDYDYDPIGNRETALGQNGTTSITYAANELNQYEAVGQQAPVYDEDGNLLNDGTKVLAYNAENQLVRVEVPGVSVSTYDYDYMGRRVRKSVDLVSGDDYVVTWVYSGWNKIEERKTVGSTTTVKNFVWGLDLSQSMEGAGGIGGLMAVIDDSGDAGLFAFDGNGNVSEVVDAGTGSVAAHYEWDAFGNELVATGPLAQQNNYRFSTKQIDPETGLIAYELRYYEPSTGRWVNRDPIGERGGLNLYGMVGNHPNNSVDRLGQREFDAYCDYQTFAKQKGLSVLARDKVGTQGHWFRADRRNMTLGLMRPMPQVWEQANNYNFGRAEGYEEYLNFETRVAFYDWFQRKLSAAGHAVTWPGAAARVAAVAGTGVQIDTVLVFVLSEEAAAAAWEINRRIFQGAWADMRRLAGHIAETGGAIAPEVGAQWDSDFTMREQTIFGEVYSRLSPEAQAELESAARQTGFLNTVGGAMMGLPAFDEQWDFSSLEGRWKYGMGLMGHQHTQGMPATTTHLPPPGTP